MSKQRTMKGASCVLLVTLAAVPAAAGTLTDFAASLTGDYSAAKPTSGNTLNSWFLGGSAAGPLGEPNLNFQVDLGHKESWANHFNAGMWNFGGNIFWAGADERIGANVDYEGATHFGQIANGGGFGEMYFGNLTAMAKAGYLSSSGNGPIGGGRGGYFGGALAAYFIPDLSVTVGATNDDLVSGRGCQVCGRGDFNSTKLEIQAEFLFDEDYGLSGFAGYSYDWLNDFNHGGAGGHTNAFVIGLYWYTGGGSLIDHHRNGTLNPWLPGSGLNIVGGAGGGGGPPVLGGGGGGYFGGY